MFELVTTVQDLLSRKTAVVVLAEDRVQYFILAASIIAMGVWRPGLTA